MPTAQNGLPADSCRGCTLVTTVQDTGKLHAVHLDRQVTQSEGVYHGKHDYMRSVR